MAEATPESQEDETETPSLTVTEIAEMEAGTAGALSPLLSRLDVIVNCLICVGSAVLAIIMPSLVTSGGINIGRSYATMSPSLIPQLVFGILAIMAAVAAIAAFKRFRESDGVSSGNEIDGFARAGFAAFVVLLYMLSVTWLGFVLSTMIVAIILSYFLGLRNPLSYIPVVVVVPILIRFIFERLLFISLPRSSIESIGHMEDQVILFLANTFLQ